MRTLIFLLCSLSFLSAGPYEERINWITHSIEGVIRSVDPTALVGVKVITLDTGKTLYEKNGEKRFVPASSLKLFTAAAALDRFGEEGLFETKLVTDGTIEKRVLKGSCYLIGSGDPSLKGEDLIELVDKLRMSEITGDLYLDITCFDEVAKGPGWMWDETLAYWSVPLSALNIEHNYMMGQVIVNPEKFVASILKGLLDRKGILLRGELKFGKAPEESSLLAIHYSEPIKELIKPVLEDSNNLYADCLFKKMGGSWEKGRESVETFLKECIHLDPEELRVLDGSGLSRYNLVSPDQMVLFLKEMQYHKSFRRALAVSGEKGTLKGRMLKDGGLISGKTGSMTGVSSLCGYIKTDSKKELGVAIFINGYMKDGKEIKTLIEDQICHILVRGAP